MNRRTLPRHSLSVLLVISSLVPHEKKCDPMNKSEKVSMVQSAPYFSLLVHGLIRKIYFGGNYI